MTKTNNSFCVMPFYGYDIRWNIQCCLMKNGSDVNEVRKSMIEGKRSEACQLCWNLEDRGLTSDRQLKNQMLDYYLDKDINFIEEDCRNGMYETRIYKIDSSTHCNAACVTCDLYSSSFWAKLKNNPHRRSTTLEEIEKNLNYKTAIDINFRGGEPLLSQTNFQILEKLLENNNNNCLITFTTNGSIKLNKKQIDILSNFKNIGFNLSIDATEKAFEYIRYPLKWNDILENIDSFRKITNKISVSCTISNISLLYYDRMVNWFNSNDLKYNYNPVYHPRYFQPRSLSKDIKNIITKKIDNQVVRGFLLDHDKTDEDNFIEMKKQIAYQDRLKGIHIKDYLPELYNLVKFDH